jgi:hypothetical protein
MFRKSVRSLAACGKFGANEVSTYTACRRHCMQACVMSVLSECNVRTCRVFDAFELLALFDKLRLVISYAGSKTMHAMRRVQLASEYAYSRGLVSDYIENNR